MTQLLSVFIFNANYSEKNKAKAVWSEQRILDVTLRGTEVASVSGPRFESLLSFRFRARPQLRAPTTQKPENEPHYSQIILKAILAKS